MGAEGSVFSREELDVYEATTCLSGAEVQYLYDKFCGLLRDKRGRLPKKDPKAKSGVLTKVKMAKVCEQEELANNPFKERLCQVFSSEKAYLNGVLNPTWGDLAFDDFVDMYNCLSPNASKDAKARTAFRIYDFDDNGYLTLEDMTSLLTTIATPPDKDCLFKPTEVTQVASRIMRDCDLDGNSRLSFLEFSKMMEKVPEFAAKFSIPVSDTSPGIRGAPPDTAILGGDEDEGYVSSDDEESDAESDDEELPPREPPAAGGLQRKLMFACIGLFILAAIAGIAVFYLDLVALPSRRLAIKDEP